MKVIYFLNLILNTTLNNDNNCSIPYEKNSTLPFEETIKAAYDLIEEITEVEIFMQSRDLKFEIFLKKYKENIVPWIGRCQNLIDNFDQNTINDQFSSHLDIFLEKSEIEYNNIVELLDGKIFEKLSDLTAVFKMIMNKMESLGQNFLKNYRMKYDHLQKMAFQVENATSFDEKVNYLSKFEELKSLDVDIVRRYLNINNKSRKVFEQENEMRIKIKNTISRGVDHGKFLDKLGDIAEKKNEISAKKREILKIFREHKSKIEIRSNDLRWLKRDEL